MKLATVEKVVLNDKDPNLVNVVYATYRSAGAGAAIICYPLNLNARYVPVIGEQIYVISANSSEAGGTTQSRMKNYYLSPVSLQYNINHNSLPELTSVLGNVSPDFASIGAGVPTGTPSLTPPDLGNGFKEVPSLSQLQGYLGDVIYEGRFGQSIRFGYTPQNVSISNKKVDGTNIKPSWTSTKPESPITIISNGRGESRGYNKFVIEDINKDDSSIWLGSKQKILIRPSQKFTLGVLPPNQYMNPQIVINSERVIINSKKDSVLISGKKSVNISTNGWKADMNEMFNQIDALKNQIQQLNTAMTTYATTINGIAIATPVPFGPLAGAAGPLLSTTATISSNLATITSKLQLMKQ